MPANPDTTYTFTSTGTGNAITAMSVSGTTVTFTKGATFNNYTHPTYTSQELKLYKVAIDGTGHTSSTATVSKADITALGIPSQDTTYTMTTTGSGNAVTSVALGSDNKITVTKGATYNNYTHPTYTSQESGLYKITVDGTGHVSSTTAASISDLSHSHGNIAMAGTMTATVAIANGDRLVITDSSDSKKITSTSITFDGSTATKALTQKGTWETFNNYSHPTYTSQELKLYKVAIDGTGHTSSTATVSKADITALGIPAQDTTYTFTTSGSGNALTGFTASGSTITFNTATYNNYSHPTYTSQESGFYKVTINGTGHVSSVTTVSKADITGLGIPSENTTYTFTSTGTGNAITSMSVSGTTITFTKGATYNNYSHPTYTSQESGLYKITVNGTGHVSGTATVSKADITNLGIPAQDTTYTMTTTGSGNAVTSVTLGTDHKITVTKGSTFNNYTHPTYTSQESGLYKITVDGTGHVSSTTTASISDLSHSHGNIAMAGTMTATVAIANGDRLVITDSSGSHKIAGSSISFDGSTATKALTQKGTWETFNNYTHPSYTSHEAGFYKVTINDTGHVSAVSTVSKADITALGIPGSDTDTKVTNTVGTASKYYVAGPTSSSTSTGTQVFDTGVYVTTTAGELNATQFKVNEAVQLKYNSTTKSLDFIFA